MISDRVAVKLAIQQEIATHLATVEGMTTVGVHYGDPGEAISNEYVELGRITGSTEAVAFGPASSDDSFAIQAMVTVAQHTTEVLADQRCQAIVAEVHKALFRDRFLQDLNARCYPGSYDGPNGDGPLDGNPAASVAVFDINVSVPVRGS